MSRIIITGGEGPVARNDIAQEVFSGLIPRGKRMYPIMSDMDDFWSIYSNQEERERIGVPEDYTNGGTLTWAVPFYITHGVSDINIRNMSRNVLNLVDGAERGIKYLNSRVGPVFMVSTSYGHYMEAVAKEVGLPMENVRCTHLDLSDKAIHPDKDGLGKIWAISDELAAMERFDIQPIYSSTGEFPEEVRGQVERLNEMFWKELASIPAVGNVLDTVKPVGGMRKVEAIKEITGEADCAISGVCYVGDNITDMEAMREVQHGGGLTVAFNASGDALRYADVAILSQDAGLWTILGEAFLRYRKGKALDFARQFSDVPEEDRFMFLNKQALVPNSLTSIHYPLVEGAFRASVAHGPPRMACLRDYGEHQKSEFIKESEEFRKQVEGVRGEIR